MIHSQKYRIPLVVVICHDQCYTCLKYQNDHVQQYKDITKPEMNIIHLNRDATPDMTPLSIPPSNPYIALGIPSRDHKWCTLHFPIIQTIDPNLYKNTTLAQLYALIDKYNLSQINHLQQNLQIHYDTTKPPIIIQTNSFPYVLLLISNIFDFLHTYGVCLPPNRRPQSYQQSEQKRDNKLKQILLSILRVANPQTCALLPKGDNSLQFFG